jgi:hypothetical protein
MPEPEFTSEREKTAFLVGERVVRQEQRIKVILARVRDREPCSVGWSRLLLPGE